MKYTWPDMMVVTSPLMSTEWPHAAIQYGITSQMLTDEITHWRMISTAADFPSVASFPPGTPWLQLPNSDPLLVNAMRNRFGSPKSLHDIIIVDASDSVGWRQDKLRAVDSG